MCNHVLLQKNKTMPKTGWMLLVALGMSLTGMAQSLKVESAWNPDGSLSRGQMENGQKNGLWVTYDQQRMPKRLEEYKNGQRHGFFMENDEHGHPLLEGWFYEGEPVGKHLQFIHGTLIREMDFDSSLIKEFYENSMPKRIGSLKDGQPDGKMTQYYETGVVLAENQYVMGKKTGTQKYFYQNGMTQAEYQTLDDALNGYYRDYHENGKPATEGTYENNMKQGLWKEYDESGKLVKQTKYKNDTEVK